MSSDTVGSSEIVCVQFQNQLTAPLNNEQSDCVFKTKTTVI